jgi:2-polyprenyl-3-methyl-5-hydroxy-6-metoxy-1,4-benzoquinol methylase
MFLRQRATQAEYCDEPDLPARAVASNYHQLARFNRVVRVSDAFQRLLVRWLGSERVARLSILDLGAGDGWMGNAVTRWAARRGWDWRVTNLDLNPLALGLRTGPRNVAADACRLPFRDGSFDLVIASQMAHHLTETEVIGHFREAWRVTRDALYLTDVHRNPASLAVIWVVLKLLGTTPEFREDGLQSIRRGWRVGEWRRLAGEAAIAKPRIWISYGSRVMLQARKPARF